MTPGLAASEAPPEATPAWPGSPPASDRVRVATPARPAWGDRVWTGLRGLFGTPALAWGTAAVQLVVIGWLVAVPRPEPVFQTLSSPAAAPAPPRRGCT